MGGFNTSGCFNDGSINLTVSGSTPGYTYLWNTGELTQDVSGLDAGTFSVTITDANGCTLFVDTTLNEAPPVTATAQVVSDYNGQDVSCFGASDGSVSVTPGGGVAPYNFQWVDAFNNPVSTNQTPTGLARRNVYCDRHRCQWLYKFHIGYDCESTGDKLSCGRFNRL
jgi:hypothetical protein